MEQTLKFLLNPTALLALAFLLTIALLLAGRLQRALRQPREKAAPLMLTPRFSPVGPDFEGTDERWLELAAEVCQQHNRRLGIIAMQLVHAGDPDVGLPARDAEACLAELAREFAAVLRPSDMVSTRGEREMIIGVPFVLEKSQISGVAKRLERVFERVVATTGLPARADFGISMYPVDGATGRELIQSAQHDAEHPTVALEAARTEGPRLMSTARA